jgi:DNA-binding LacI/PurR family transcriptional regulator
MTRKSSSSVTIRDVARKVGVSVATISRYLNRSAPVSDDVATRIEQVVAEMQYVPHPTARNLATHKVRSIGMLLSTMMNEYVAPLLSGAESVARREGYNLLVATYRGEQRDGLPAPIGPHNTQGLLIFADAMTDKELLSLYEKHFPMILIHRTPPPGTSIPSVTIENKAAVRSLVGHLIEEHGCHRLLYMRGPVLQDDARWREVGFKDALAGHNIPFDPDLVIQGDFDREIAYSNLRSYLDDAKHPPFDAIVAGDDDTAIGALNALSERGLRVPEDVPVVGFDDMSISAFLHPALTTVNAPTERVGQTAAQMLVDYMANRHVDETVLLPTEMIIRHSCGCGNGHR